MLAVFIPAFFQGFVQRLQTRPQFQAVMAGSIVAKTEHFVLHRNGLDARPPLQASAVALFPVNDVWIGAMVPKRWAKRAVTRNTIKRQIYTISAGFAQQYPLAAFVVRQRREFSRQHFVSATSSALRQAVREELFALMKAGAKPI